MAKTPTNAIFQIPTVQGTYWYYCEDREKFIICDVIEKDNEMRAKFTNSSFQRWCGKKSYFIGPIAEPVINEDGTWEKSK